jgi:TonB family protein
MLRSIEPLNTLQDKITAMRPRVLLLTTQLVVVACSVTSVANAVAQATAVNETQKPQVTLTKLSPPVYPPLCRQARIMGDVKIQVKIRRDGSVDSAAVISGHRLLQEAALDSARKSKFECRGCEAITTYSLIYTFGFREDGSDCSVRRLRSAKCLYLWKCGPRFYSAPRPPEVTQSEDHIMILADTDCVNTMPSSSGG